MVINYMKMGVLLNKYALFLALLFFPALICSQEAVKQSKASYFYGPGGLGSSEGACGFGDYGRTINDGNVAVVCSSKIYKGGAGCGACYKVKCKEVECNEDGVTVVVTDHAGELSGVDDTDFILSTHAFNKMAKPGSEKDLIDYGKVSIEYQRVACHYPSKDLLLKVGEHSHYPYYLSLVFLYQAGSSDIAAVELFEEDTLEWKTCRRAYGAVWDMSNPPKGPLTIRFFLAGSATVKARWVLVPKVIPAFWLPGVTYDTSVHLN